MIPHRTLTNCTEPNDEIQTDFGGPIINVKEIEQIFKAKLDIYSN